MKVSMYMDSNTKQINLEPENKYESDLIESFSKRKSEVVFSKGNFSDCRGGYKRLYTEHTEELIMYIKEIKGEEK